MDLIYANEDQVELGVLNDYNFDLAFGDSENDFELTVHTNNSVCKAGYFVYINDTEYGGIIDEIKVDTSNKEVTYKGRTFHGILATKVIRPDPGEDYYVASGDVKAIISNLINRLNISGLFRVSAGTSVSVNNYKFGRYVNAYKGIMSMLESVNYKLIFIIKKNWVELDVTPIDTYADDEIDSDLMNFIINKSYIPVNHLICLGQGELKDRTVIDLYLDKEGKISSTQVYTGLDEKIEVYDYSSVESDDELEKAGKEQLLSYKNDEVQVYLDASKKFDIGDIVSAKERVTGIEVQKAVTKKIVTINKNKLLINYKVGE